MMENFFLEHYEILIGIVVVELIIVIIIEILKRKEN